MASLTRHEHGHLAHAIFHERVEAADLMLVSASIRRQRASMAGPRCVRPAGSDIRGWCSASSRTAALRSRPEIRRTTARRSLLAMALGNPAMQKALRRHGAR